MPFSSNQIVIALLHKQIITSVFLLLSTVWMQLYVHEEIFPWYKHANAAKNLLTALKMQENFNRMYVG